MFWPNPKLPQKVRNAYIAEGHNRLAQPLYCIAFGLIALAVITRGRRARGAQALRITMAAVAAALLRIAGYGVQGLATHHPSLSVLFYVIPLVGAVGAAAMLAGFDPLAFFRGQGKPAAEIAA